MRNSVLFLWILMYVLRSDSLRCIDRLLDPEAKGSILISPSFRGGLGIFATKTIEKGDKILSISKSELISQRNAIEDISSYFDIPTHTLQEILPVEKIELSLILFAVLYLVKVNNFTGRCVHYVQTFPMDLNSVPKVAWMYPVSELAKQRKLVIAKDQVINFVENYYNSLSLRNEIELVEFLKYVATVGSRIHHVNNAEIKFGGYGQEKMLVPYADMINTGSINDVNLKCLTNMKTGSFDCYATKRIEKSKELIVSYGLELQLNNFEFFMTYGLTFNKDRTICAEKICNLANTLYESMLKLLLDSLCLYFANFQSFLKA